MRWHRWQGTCLIGAAAVIAACGGSGDGGNGNNPVIAIAKTSTLSGDLQNGTVGAALPQALRVFVTEDGDPLEGQTVVWTAQQGSVSAGTSQTNTNGVATIVWTLGSAAGPQTATAALAGATGSPVTFSATGAPDVPAALVEFGGADQVGVVNTAFGAPLQVKVTDQFNNPRSGIAVDWVVQSGSATVGAASSVTNASGIASMTVTAGGTPGAAVVRASAVTVAGANVDYDLTVILAPVEVGMGNIFFQSGKNNTLNPAVDTVQQGGAVRWTGLAGSHTVRSQGVPQFTSSGTINQNGTYLVVFNATGTYQYDCGIHGGLPGGMAGTVVVIP
ncbi:MAG: Ig-like domain-containing protein [Gemmatimonadota bacterium]|nr:Ig-like domain-containing protein [Gemmatimonadota bacterium]